MTGKQETDDMTPDTFKVSAEEAAKKQAERDALVDQMTTPVNQPVKIKSEQLYTRCPRCHGLRTTQTLVDADGMPVEMVPCWLCDGIGFMDAGIHTGQVDKLAQAKAGIEDLIRHVQSTMDNINVYLNNGYGQTGDPELPTAEFEQGALDAYRGVFNKLKAIVDGRYKTHDPSGDIPY